MGCPGCTKPLDPDGLGIDDAKGRKWHGDCARRQLSKFRRDMIGACPFCQTFLGHATGIADDRRRQWHFEGDGNDCVARALATQ